MNLPSISFLVPEKQDDFTEAIPPKGCMANLSTDRIAQLAEYERKRLPVLACDKDGNSMIQFSAFLSHASDKKEPASRKDEHSIKRSLMQIEALPEDFEGALIDNASAEYCSRNDMLNSLHFSADVGHDCTLSDNDDEVEVDWRGRPLHNQSFSANFSDADLEDESDAIQNHCSLSVDPLPFETDLWESRISWGANLNHGSTESSRQFDVPEETSKSRSAVSLTAVQTDDLNFRNVKLTLPSEHMYSRLDIEQHEGDEDDDDEYLKNISFGTRSNDVNIVSKVENEILNERKMINGVLAAWNISKTANDVSKGKIQVSPGCESQLNPDLESCTWMSNILWNGVVIKPVYPLVDSVNDKGCITRKEVENAYGIDIRPGSVRRSEARMILRQREAVDSSKIGKKQFKKLTKQNRVHKLVEYGYFRFIDAIKQDNLKDGKGVRDRLRFRRLPEIPRDVHFNTALYLRPELRTENARLFHRPRLSLPPSLKVVLWRRNRDLPGMRRIVRTKWDFEDVSGTSGPICLVEYMEQRPPLLCQVGMSSLLVNFCMSESVSADGNPATEPQAILSKRRAGDSRKCKERTVLLEPTDRSPFFAILGKKEECLSLFNDLWVAPVAEHRVRPGDFLIVREHYSRGRGQVSDECVIRNIESVHLVGQTEPSHEVFHPLEIIQRSNKKPGVTNFLEKFVEYHLVKRLKVNKLSFEQIKSLFGLVSPNFVKKVHDNLLSVAGKQGHDIASNLPMLEHVREQISRSYVAKYESFQAGLRRLYDLGMYETALEDVTHVMHAHAVLIDIFHIAMRSQYALQEAVRSGGTVGVVPESQREKEIARHRVTLSSDAQLRLKTALFIVDELQLTPWHLTFCYTKMRMSESPNLKLTGLGDPSGRMEAVSYLPESVDGISIRTKSSRRWNRQRYGEAQPGSAAFAAARSAIAAEKKEESASEKKKSGKSQQGYGGTESDLRGLTIDDGERILLALGHSPQEIEPLDRWDRITLVESYASVAGVENIPNLGKFARNVNPLSEKEKRERDEVQKKVNRLFKAQLTAIASRETPVFLSKAETAEAKAERRKLRKKKLARRRELAVKTGADERLHEKDFDTRSDGEEKSIQPEYKDDSDESVNLPSGSDDSGDDSDEDFDSDHQDSQMEEAKTLESVAIEEKGNESDENDDEAEAFMESLVTSSKRQDTTGHGAVQKNAIGTEMTEEQRALQHFRDKMAKNSNALDSEKKREMNLIDQADARAKERRIPMSHTMGRHGDGKEQIVRRVVIRTNATGETEVVVEYDKSPSAIRRVREAKEASLYRARQSLESPEGPSLAYRDSMAKRNSAFQGAKPRKKQEQELALAKKRYESYKENIQKHGRDWPLTVPGDKRCASCRLPGHNSNSRKCPLYFKELADNADIKGNMSDLKLVIGKSAAAGLYRGAGNSDLSIRELKKKVRTSVKRSERGTNRRNKVGDLNQTYLAKAVEAMWSLGPNAAPFIKRVDKRLVPGYYDIVRPPYIFLEKLRDRCTRKEYNSSLQFVEDVQIMCDNAKRFNGADHPIYKSALLLLDAAQGFLEKHHEAIDAIEAEIKAAGIMAVPKKRRRVAQTTVRSPPRIEVSVPDVKPDEIDHLPQSSVAMDPLQISTTPGFDSGTASATPSNNFFAIGSSPSPSPDSFPIPTPSSEAIQPSPSPLISTPFTPLPGFSPPAAAEQSAALLSAGDLVAVGETSKIVADVFDASDEEEEIID